MSFLVLSAGLPMGVTARGMVSEDGAGGQASGETSRQGRSPRLMETDIEGGQCLPLTSNCSLLSLLMRI